jgi:branched-chain amino acid transport system ATP-binding protein
MSDQLPGDLPQYVSAQAREQQLDLDAAQHEAPTTLSGSEIQDRNAHIDGARDALVVADDVVAGYIPGVNILNGSDLYAKSGELVGIIGPNGAGKSTLLKAMFGLVRVRTGRVTLADQDITNVRADQLVNLGIGFVPQTNNVFPSLTIQENLEMGCYQAPKKSCAACRAAVRR